MPTSSQIKKTKTGHSTLDEFTLDAGNYHLPWPAALFSYNQECCWPSCYRGRLLAYFQLYISPDSELFSAKPGSSSSRQFYSLEVIMQVILTLGYVFAFFNVEHYSTPQTISTICTRLFWIAVLSLQYIVCFLQLSTTENHLKIHSVPPPQSFTKPLNTTSTGIAPWGMLLINSPSFSSSNTVV